MPTFKSYFVISPTDYLLEALQDIPNTWWKEVRVWSLEETDDSFPDREQFYLTVMKLTFLTNVVRTKKRNTREEEIHDRLFGCPPIYSVEVFDRWWFIERLQAGENFSYIMNKATSDDLKQLEPTGNEMVDEWFDSYIRQMERREHDESVE